MIKLDQLLKLVSLEKQALQAASRFIGLPKLAEELTPSHATLLVLCDLLNQKGFEKDHQYAIVEIVKGDVDNYIANPDDRFLGVQILDYNYVVLPMWSQPYDYKALEFI